MDGKDKIIEEILSEATNYQLEVTKKADDDYQVVVDKAQTLAKENLDKNEQALKLEQEEMLKRRSVLAGLDGKKLYLCTKTQAVDDVFNNALKKLNNLDKSAYRSVITRLIKENATSNSTVILAKNCPFTANEVMTFDIVKELNLKIKDGGDFNGGVIIESQNADINVSFEAIIMGLKEKYETYVAEKLFD